MMRREQPDARLAANDAAARISTINTTTNGVE